MNKLTIPLIIVSCMWISLVWGHWAIVEQKDAAISNLKCDSTYHAQVIESQNMEINALFNPYNLYAKIQQYKIKSPQIVYKQAILETGNFTSRAFFERNNLFGFTTDTLLSFNTWIDCVKYYKRWQDKHYNDNIGYYNFLKEYNYSGDTNYVEHLKKVRMPYGKK